MNTLFYIVAMTVEFTYWSPHYTTVNGGISTTAEILRSGQLTNIVITAAPCWKKP